MKPEVYKSTAPNDLPTQISVTAVDKKLFLACGVVSLPNPPSCLAGVLFVGPLLRSCTTSKNTPNILDS